MLERGEAIGLLVILAVILAATIWVGVRRTPSFAFVFAPVELMLGGWVAATTDWDEPGAPPSRRGTPGGDPPGHPRGGGGGSVREPRRPRPSSGAGTTARNR
ncbi:MAG: hypothetical protein QOI86_3094 [Actinomycetota bacterium]|nr:hypothetical protein [Actinomycetota bacterium]